MFLVVKCEPMNFTLWFSEHKEDLEQEFLLLLDSQREEQECQDCDGSGVVECNMGCEHDCEECDGKGKVKFTLRDYAMDEYRYQVSKDRAAISKYEKFMKEFA